LVRIADAAVVEAEDAEARREPGEDRLPAPARVAETLHEQQRRPAPPLLPRDLHRCIASCSRCSVRGRRTRPIRASPPGTKKTTRMKSTPSTKSGCCSGVRTTDGSDETAWEADASPSRWSAHV